MPFGKQGPVLRVCVPEDTKPGGVQCYNISFRDDAQFKQAIAALYSSGNSPSSSNRSSPASSHQSSERSTPPSATSTLGSSVCSTSDTQETERLAPQAEDPEEAKKLADRLEALEFLEGKKTPIPNRDYGNAEWKVLFEYWAWQEQVDEQLNSSRERAPVVQNSEISETNPLFTWSALHKVLHSQISAQNQSALPEADEELVPTLLFLSKETKGMNEEVRSRAPLAGKSVKFFEALMLDVMVRGWTDVLWLGRRGEELPEEVKQQGVSLSWGENMI